MARGWGVCVRERWFFGGFLGVGGTLGMYVCSGGLGDRSGSESWLEGAE